MSHSIHAATILWTNTLGGNWSDPGSWSPNTIPSDSDDVFILAAGTFDVSLDTSTTVNSLTIAGEPGSAPTFHTGISTLTVNSSVAVNGGGSLEVEGGALLGTNAAVTVHGVLGWSGGSVGNGGSVWIAPDGIMALYSGNDSMYGPLTNSGTIALSGGNLQLLGACFDNSGMLVNQTNGLVIFEGDVGILALCGTETVTNYGTVMKSGTIGTTDITAPFYNFGTLDVESGTVSLDGTYSLTNGIVNFGISNLYTFGTLALSGDPAQLAGTVSATLVGDYQPIATNEFPVITYTSESGVFTNETLPNLDAWQTDYGQTNFSLTVLNARPMIDPVADETIGEFSTLADFAAAGDADQPLQALTFSLTHSPPGMTIDPVTGLIIWSPAQTQSPSTNSVTVVVTDNGTPPLSTNTSFSVVVFEQNIAPVWTNTGVKTVNESALLRVDMAATEKNIHGKIAGYQLVNPPVGASIDSNGIVTWTPTQAQSPSTNLVTIAVTNIDLLDTSTPILVAMTNFTVIVFAPTLAPIQNYSVSVGGMLAFTNIAADNDPTRKLTFSMVAGPPSASVGASNGVFVWKPGSSYNATSNAFMIQVTDDSVPPLVASQSFSVYVGDVLVSPTTGALQFLDGHFQFQVTGPVGPTYTIDATSVLPAAQWTNLGTFVPTNVPFIFIDTNSPQNARIYRVKLQ